MDDFVTALEEEFRRQGLSDEVSRFPIVAYLGSGGWMELGSPDAVEEVFCSHVYPLLGALTDGNPARPVWVAAHQLRQSAEAHARRTLTDRANEIRYWAVASGALEAADTRPLAVSLCDSYLRSGIKHVLVGMRRTRYVEMMQPFLQRIQGSAARPPAPLRFQPGSPP
jgi:hypothetical protein